jgi:hypothetical protein
VAQLTWDQIGERFYESGVDRGVLFVDNSGYAWSGLVSVEEAPSGGDARAFYIDGEKYLNLAAKEEFEATINAYYSPVQFDACDGVLPAAPGLFATQQRRKSFGLSYRTKIGNDVDGQDHGYKIHIVYNALVAPTQRTRSTVSDDVDIPVLSWPITTKPVAVPGMKRTSHFVVDSTEAGPNAMSALEAMLYGSDTNPSTLPTVQQLIDMFTFSEEFVVEDLTGGEYSISGSIDDIALIGDGLWEITHDTVVPIDADSTEISSA